MRAKACTFLLIVGLFVLNGPASAQYRGQRQRQSNYQPYSQPAQTRQNAQVPDDKNYNYSEVSKEWEKKAIAELIGLYETKMRWVTSLEGSYTSWLRTQQKYIGQFPRAQQENVKKYIEVEKRRRDAVIPLLATEIQKSFDVVSAAIYSERRTQLTADNRGDDRMKKRFSVASNFVSSNWSSALSTFERGWEYEKRKQESYLEPDLSAADLQDPKVDFDKHKDKKLYFAYFLSGKEVPEYLSASLKNDVDVLMNGKEPVNLSFSNGTLYYHYTRNAYRTKGVVSVYFYHQEEKKIIKQGETEATIEKEFVLWDDTTRAELNRKLLELAEFVLIKKKGIEKRKAEIQRAIASPGIPTAEVDPVIFYNETPGRSPEAPERVLDLQNVYGDSVVNGVVSMVDWDGYIANPAVKLVFHSPPSANYPIEVSVTANEPRLYFQNGAKFGANGPSSYFTISKYEKDGTPLYVSIWPDRDSDSESHSLLVNYRIASRKLIDYEFGGWGLNDGGSFEVRLIVDDQDKQPQSPTLPKPIERRAGFPYLTQPKALPIIRRPFPFIPDEIDPVSTEPFVINLNFERDESEFFEEASHKISAVRAADDWAYFIDSMGFTPVKRGEEHTELYKGGDPLLDKSYKDVENRVSYRDFMVYLRGVANWKDSFGVSSAAGKSFHESRGKVVEFMRSGDLIVGRTEERVGYETYLSDEDWFKSDYGDDKIPNLYSVVSHEIGHLLGFDAAYPSVPKWESSGIITDLAVQDYLGSFPNINAERHLARGQAVDSDIGGYHPVLDNASLKGAFGTTQGFMPQRRWIITKLDLMVLESLGYRLKSTSAFTTLKFLAPSLKAGSHGQIYFDRLQVEGGTPDYHWQVISGALPDGLKLDSMSGIIEGTPLRRGVYHFVVRVNDLHGARYAGLNRACRIQIH